MNGTTGAAGATAAVVVATGTLFKKSLPLDKSYKK